MDKEEAPPLEKAVRVLGEAGFRVFDVAYVLSGNATKERMASDFKITLSITPLKNQSVEKGYGIPVKES